MNRMTASAITVTDRQPARFRVPVVSLTIATLMVILQYTLTDHSALVFDQEAIWRGELWRLLTGHFVHADTGHLQWNLVALLVLGVVLEQTRRHLLLIALLAGIIAIDLWLMSPFAAVSRYCGLSGVLNTELVVLLWQEWQSRKTPILWLTGLLALAKIGVELVTQQSLFTHFSWPPYPPAHLCGFLAGLLTVAYDHALMKTKTCASR